MTTYIYAVLRFSVTFNFFVGYLLSHSFTLLCSCNLQEENRFGFYFMKSHNHGFFLMKITQLIF